MVLFLFLMMLKNTSRIRDKMLLSSPACCFCALPTGCYIIKGDLATSFRTRSSSPSVTSSCWPELGLLSSGKGSSHKAAQGLTGALVKFGPRILASCSPRTPEQCGMRKSDWVKVP